MIAMMSGRLIRPRQFDAGVVALLTSDLILADIALECGFADQSHFARTFQRAAGMGPGAWRRIYRR
jgi:AraC family transcriptional regulator